MEELIARGGTFGLILALVLAVGFLIRLALLYVDKLLAEKDVQIVELRGQVADWRGQATRATDGFTQATGAFDKLTGAMDTRNRIEEEQLREDQLKREIRRETRQR